MSRKTLAVGAGAIGWDDAKWLVGNGKARRSRIPGVMCLPCATP